MKMENKVKIHMSLVQLIIMYASEATAEKGKKQLVRETEMYTLRAITGYILIEYLIKK